LTEKTGG